MKCSIWRPFPFTDSDREHWFWPWSFQSTAHLISDFPDKPSDLSRKFVNCLAVIPVHVVLGILPQEKVRNVGVHSIRTINSRAKSEKSRNWILCI